MPRIGNILENCFHELGIEKPIKRYKALLLWPKIVGEKMASVTEPQRMSKGKIFVKVKTHSWKQEITFYKPEIIKKLNQEIGEEVIEDIILF